MATATTTAATATSSPAAAQKPVASLARSQPVKLAALPNSSAMSVAVDLHGNIIDSHGKLVGRVSASTDSGSSSFAGQKLSVTVNGAGEMIDSSGALPDGTKLNGPADLRKALLDRRAQFVTAVTEKLLTYALGRGIDYYDQPAIRRILREAAPSEYQWSAIILGIVKSPPFQMRMAPEPEASTASSSQRRTQQ